MQMRYIYINTVPNLCVVMHLTPSKMHITEPNLCVILHLTPCKTHIKKN